MRSPMGSRVLDVRGLLLLVTVSLGLCSAAGAQMNLPRSATSGGFVDAAGGPFRLLGTVGEAGLAGGASGGAFVMGQGFWSGLWVVQHVVDAPTPEDPAASRIEFVNSLRPNSPNPFRGTTTIRYTVGHSSPVHLQLYDVSGRRIATLSNTSHVPGHYRVIWDGRDGFGNPVASGVYFYRLDVGNWSMTRKLLKLH